MPVWVEGAKAAAEPIRAERIADFMVIGRQVESMVYISFERGTT